MLKYLIIPLTKDSVSFCHYERGESNGEMIPLDVLNEALTWAMKENLNVQFLYPDHPINDEYKTVLDSVDHTDIVSSDCTDIALRNGADIMVYESWKHLTAASFNDGHAYVIRTTKEDLFSNIATLSAVLAKINRLVVIITDIDGFTEQDFARYESALAKLIPVIKDEYVKGHPVQLNLLTDRILLDKMNNCNAGWESVTLAPDGKFYVCPAFWLDGSKAIGDLQNGLDIKNPQLYRLDHAPICRQCDAWQCRRCVWLNRKTTLEVNTPSHQQCVVAHIERNTSKKLLDAIREAGSFMPEKQISKIEYLDPFDVITGFDNNVDLD